MASPADHNRTRRPYPCTSGRDTIHAVFREAAAANPTKLALVTMRHSARGDGAGVTYRELDARTERLCAALCELGVLTPTHRLVALLFERSVEMVADEDRTSLPLVPPPPRSLDEDRTSSRGSPSLLPDHPLAGGRHLRHAQGPRLPSNLTTPGP
jgi:hypothetical protein